MIVKSQYMYVQKLNALKYSETFDELKNLM
jgi:hypothetical protein